MTFNNPDSDALKSVSKPGSFLAAEREKRGLSIEHIANKLNLRAQVLQHLEADEYDALPQAVFVKGYIRAYCKHLDLNCADDLIRAYTAFMPVEAKFVSHLWQNHSHIENDSGEKWLRWVTGIFIIGILASLAIWVMENKPTADFLPKELFQSSESNTTEQSVAAAAQKDDGKTDVKVTDLSKMRKLLNENTVEQNLTVPAKTE
jgi:cytoskeleton protein RodZ